MGIGNIADTGMQAAMANMEVISNNIANANTLGFKRSFVNFADIYPSANGSSGNQIGLGVEVNDVGQDFTTGSFLPTNGRLDLSINKGGFFVLHDAISGQVSYTRAGRFEQSKDGYIVYGNQHLQGYQAINGVIPPGGIVSDLSFNTHTLPAKATGLVDLSINLNSNEAVLPGPFDPTMSSTYNFSSTSPIYDSLGNSHNVVSYYVKTAANNWNVNVYVDGASVGSGNMVFSSSGQLTSTTGLNALSYNPTTGATSPQNFTLDYTGSTQVGSPNDVSSQTSDGYPPGNFSFVTVDKNGMVYLQYSNDQRVLSGQVAIANFPSVDGLTDIGNMQWVSTSSSGNPIYNQSASTNNINVGAVELSNVDLTSEMVSLITAQHTFQANAQVEQVYNDVMKTVIQL